jgi:hypothetical protein
LCGWQLAEDLRERWETSDSPVVHKIQEYVLPFVFVESLGLVCCSVAYQCTLEKQFHTFKCGMAIFLVLESLVGYKILWFKLFLHSIFFTTSSQMFSCLIVWIQFGPMFVVCSANAA